MKRKRHFPESAAAARGFAASAAAIIVAITGDPVRIACTAAALAWCAGARCPAHPVTGEQGSVISLAPAMNNESSTVSAEVGLRLIVSRDTVVPLMASLFYSGGDPYAIRIVFHTGLDEPVEWVFARDLLADGISGRTGLGDVQVWPSAAEPGIGRDMLNIGLSSPSGQAHFAAPAEEITNFLARTYRIVKADEEDKWVGIESELNDLLRQR
jgi:hypothetical protein